MELRPRRAVNMPAAFRNASRASADIRWRRKPHGRPHFVSSALVACVINSAWAGITVTLPKPMTSNAKAAGRFGKQDFRYVAAEDVYICPAGQRLAYFFTTEDKGLVLRRYRTNACQSCAIKHGCATSKERQISRWPQGASGLSREPVLLRSVLHDRETGVALTMPLIPTPFHTAWAIKRRPAPCYSITSSASAMSWSGMVMPSVFAVFRFITSLNLVGCWTGRSAGLAPLRIRST